MGHMPTLISDLALILLVAGLMTLLCKKLNQPSILGYILAGVLIGPVVDFLPTVADTANITVWADIGVIFLMFSLGLEFSVHKMSEVGMAGFVSAAIKICGVGLTGFVVGQILGMGVMNSVFLGGMLSMSSTMITLKAIDDMHLRDMPFVSLVTGILVIEDIAAIFLMIILSTVAVSQNISGVELVASLGQMIFYLIIWLVLGIYLLPSFLKRAKDLMNDEMLLVLALGICFSMVWLANALGFSTALGAFMAGSILAGTIHAEHIEHLVKPCKDLFGAVFFVSVGLLVDPQVMIDYSGSIILITVVAIVSIFGFLVFGMILAGQSLNDAIYAATTQTQIGEFSFIIASLGLSLGVTSDFLYPMIVAVSVLTTFATPYMVRFAPKMIAFVDRKLPQNIQDKLALIQESKQNKPVNDSDWRSFFKSYIRSLAIYGAIAIGLILLVNKMVVPRVNSLGYFEGQMGNYVIGALLYLFILLLIPPLLRMRNSYFTALWLKNKANRIPLILLVMVRYSVACGILLLPAIIYWEIPPIMFVLVVAPAIYFARHSDRLSGQYLKIEANFLANFNERLLIENFQTEGHTHSWLDEQLYIQGVQVLDDNEIVNKTLQELNWSRIWHVKAIRIIRGKKVINIPQGSAKILPGDILCMMGEEKTLDNFILFGENSKSLKVVRAKETLREFISRQNEMDLEQQILCFAIKVQKDSLLNGKNIKESPIKNEWFGFLIGIERNLYPIVDPPVSMILQENDLLWILGTQKMGNALTHAQLL